MHTILKNAYMVVTEFSSTYECLGVARWLLGVVCVVVMGSR